MESVDLTLDVPGEPLQGELDLPGATPPPDPVVPIVEPGAVAAAALTTIEPVDHVNAWKRMGREIVAAVQTLLSAAVYATLIVTFGVQVARVDGLSMAPTLRSEER